jgi:hypothetical protein
MGQLATDVRATTAASLALSTLGVIVTALMLYVSIGIGFLYLGLSGILFSMAIGDFVRGVKRFRRIPKSPEGKPKESPNGTVTNAKIPKE